MYPTSQAALFTIDVTNTGDAGTITQLNVSAGAADVPLSGADGMRLDNHDLIVVEPSGNLWDFAIASAPLPAFRRHPGRHRAVGRGGRDPDAAIGR